MRKSTKIKIIEVCLLAALAMPIWTAAQDNPTQQKHNHHQYQLTDLGSFGGPGSATAIILPILTNSGATLGIAQTTTADPYNPNCMDGYFAGLSGCLLSHAFGWQKGVLTDLGALPGTNSSYGYGINDAGVMDGFPKREPSIPRQDIPKATPSSGKTARL